MTDEKISRRTLIQHALAGIAAVPAAALVAREAAAEELITPTDPTAQTLGYVADARTVNPKLNPTYKPGQTCANCLQYTGKPGAATGGCNIFPNKLVHAKGWCRVWGLKPGAAIKPT